MTLLALVTRQSVQTSFRIKVNNIIQEDKRIRFKIEEKLKGHEIDARIRDTLLWCPNICPAQTLVTYLEKNSDLQHWGFWKGQGVPFLYSRPDFLMWE